MHLIDDDPQLREALHRAVEGGPASPPLDDLLRTARRARRRRDLRRTTGGLAVAAVMATVALAGAQLLTGGAESRSGDRGVVAEQPEADEPGPTDLWVHVTADGRLVAGPGTTILRTLRDPLQRRPEGRSWGVVVQRGTHELWGLVDWSAAGTFSSVERAEARFAAVEDWLDYEVAASTGALEPHPVYFDQDGVLRATGATKVVQTRDEVGLGQSPDEDVLTGAAEITVRGDRLFVLARHAAGTAPRYVVLTPEQVGGDFGVLLEHARQLWAEARP